MKAITTNSFHAWVLAARPKTLTGAIIPVLIGSALAFCRRQVRPDTGTAVRTVCLRHANRSQLHQ